MPLESLLGAVLVLGSVIGAPPPSPEGGDRVPAAQAIANAIVQRERIPQGRVSLTVTSTTDDSAVTRLYEAYFAGTRCRSDRLRDAEYDGLLSRLGEDRSWVRRRLWDGEHQIRCSPRFGSWPFAVEQRDDTDHGEVNARWLGLPFSGFSDLRLAGILENVRVLSDKRDGDLRRVVLRLDQRLANRDVCVKSVGTFTLDMSKGGSIVEYVIDEESDGFNWTLKGESIVSQFGAVWYPEWFRHEQLRNGASDFALEYQVLKADFKTPIGNELTLPGLGARPGDVLISTSIGIGSLRWSGARLEPH